MGSVKELIRAREEARAAVQPSNKDIELFKGAQRTKLVRIHDKVYKGLMKNAKGAPRADNISFSNTFFGLKHPSRRISEELCEQLTDELFSEIFNDTGIKYSYTLHLNEVSAQIAISATVDKEVETAYRTTSRNGISH